MSIPRACKHVATVTLMLLSEHAAAASTYVELLKERLPARVAERNDPRVLDELELELLRCLVDSFVATNIPPDDLAKLDQAVVAGTVETDPLADHYKQLTNDPDAQALMTREAERLCPAVLQAYKSATQ
jgi:hypothetical protein